MASRHQSRVVVLQSLFEIDFRQRDKNDFEEVLDHNIEEFYKDDADKVYAKSLLDGVLKKQGEIDAIITKAAPEWPIDKIAMVDRNVLRLGLYELIFADKKEVPSKVAINEAIEVAKFFSSETSGKFINGVLGSVYKEIYGDSEKDLEKHIPKKDQNKNKSKYADMSEEEKATLPVVQVVGTFVYTHDKEGKMYIALVNDVFGFWTLAKGKIEENETVKECSARKVKEELGIDCEFVKEFDTNEYVASHPELKVVKKKVTYCVAKTTFGPLTNKKDGGIRDVAWFDLDNILDLKLYEDMVPVFKNAFTVLKDIK